MWVREVKPLSRRVSVSIPQQWLQPFHVIPLKSWARWKMAIVERLVAIGYDASISVLHTFFTSVHLQALYSPTNTRNHTPGLGRFHPTWSLISIILLHDDHFCIPSDYSIGRNWSWLGTITKRKKMIPFCFRRTSVLFFGNTSIAGVEMSGRWNTVLTWNWRFLKSSLVPLRDVPNVRTRKSSLPTR